MASLIVSRTLNSTHTHVSGFVPLNADHTVSVHRTGLDVSSPDDPGASRRITDPYPSRGYTHPATLAIEVSHAACEAEF